MKLADMITEMERRFNQIYTQLRAAERQQEFLVERQLPRDRKLNLAIAELRRKMFDHVDALQLLYARRDEPQPITENWFTFDDAVRSGATINNLLFSGDGQSMTIRSTPGSPNLVSR
jgi:hypothetical protein